MSDTPKETNNQNPNNKNNDNEKTNSNHIAGCGIFLVILATVIFIAVVSIYSYFDYKNAFIKFSEETITPTKLATTENPEAVKAIDKKFSEFGALVIENKTATMALTTDEINLAIAHFPKLEEFRNKLYITNITKTHIQARATFPINAGFDGIRHINGKLMLKPVIAQGSIFPIVDAIQADTKQEIPEKVLKAIPVLMFAGYRNDETIQAVFHKLTKVELTNGAIHITSEPGKTAIPIIDMDVTEETSAGVQLFILLTFIFITTLLFAFWFSKHKKKQIAQQ